MHSRLSSLLLIGLLFIETLFFLPNVYSGVVDRVLSQNFYFHRELSGIGNYRFLNMTEPTYSDRNNISSYVPIGVYEVGDGWITPEVPMAFNLTRNYNFLFSVWGAGGGNATVFFRFYAYRGGSEHFLFSSLPSVQMIVNVSELLWQHKTREVTLNVLEGDRLVLRLFIDVSVAGVFGMGYDCIQYPSFVNDPTETRYMRYETGSVNGGTFQWLNTSQGVTDTNSQRNLASISSEYLYPISDGSVLQWQNYNASVHWKSIDESSANDTDYVSATEALTPDHKVDRYIHTALATSDPICRLSMVVRRKGLGFIYVGFVIGSTFYYQSIASGGSNYATTVVSWDVDPNSTVAWTKNVINSMVIQVQQFGVYNQVCNVSQLYVRVYYYMDATCYWGFTVSKRDSGGLETNLTDGVQTFLTSSISAFLLAGSKLYNTTWLCPSTELSLTDSVVVGVFYKVSSWYLHTGYNFSTSQLGGVLLNSSVWTLHFYLTPTVTVTYVSSWFGWGSTIHNSRVEGFVWTEPSASWHDVSTWEFQSLTRQWATVGTWTYQILTKQWNVIATWNFQVLTKGWHMIATWFFQLESSPEITIAPILFLFVILGALIVLVKRRKDRE